MINAWWYAIANLLKFKDVSLWIACVSDEVWLIWCPKICNLPDLCPTSLDDLRKCVANILHLERQVTEAGLVDPWLITMMSYRMLVYFQKWVFEFGEFEPDRVYL